MINMLKDKFLNHHIWEDPKCIIRVVGEDFENKCKSDQGKVNLDVSKDTNHEIYSVASPCMNAIDDYWISRIDLEQVDVNLMKCAEPVSTCCPFQEW